MEKPSSCKHVHWVVRGRDRVGAGYCEDCKTLQPLTSLLNNLHDRMEWILQKFEASQPKEKP